MTFMQCIHAHRIVRFMFELSTEVGLCLYQHFVTRVALGTYAEAFEHWGAGGPNNFTDATTDSCGSASVVRGPGARGKPRVYPKP